MAKAQVIQEAVFAAADALLAVGKEPGIIAVQERIGGRSYTMVKYHLRSPGRLRKHRQRGLPPSSRRGKRAS